MYPLYLQEAFIKSFCDGIKSPHMRLAESQWIKILIQLRNDIICCQNCNFEYFLTSNNLFYQNKSALYKCKHCNSEFNYPFFIKTKDYTIPLCAGKKLYKCHTICDSNNFSDEEAYIVKNKKNPNILAIKNISQKTWYYIHNGTRTQLPPNGIGVIQDNVIIDFGNVTGQIYYKKEN